MAENHAFESRGSTHHQETRNADTVVLNRESHGGRIAQVVHIRAEDVPWSLKIRDNVGRAERENELYEAIAEAQSRARDTLEARSYQDCTMLAYWGDQPDTPLQKFAVKAAVQLYRAEMYEGELRTTVPVWFVADNQVIVFDKYQIKLDEYRDIRQLELILHALNHIAELER